MAQCAGERRSGRATAAGGRGGLAQLVEALGGVAHVDAARHAVDAKSM